MINTEELAKWITCVIVLHACAIIESILAIKFYFFTSLSLLTWIVIITYIIHKLVLKIIRQYVTKELKTGTHLHNEVYSFQVSLRGVKIKIPIKNEMKIINIRNTLISNIITEKQKFELKSLLTNDTEKLSDNPFASLEDDPWRPE